MEYYKITVKNINPQKIVSLRGSFKAYNAAEIQFPVEKV